jgi:predicted extracellular nuclease
MKRLFFTLFMGWTAIAQSQTTHLVISQVFGAGGNTDAPYSYDFVELYNPTQSPVSLAGWSLQYAGASTNNWNSNKVD